MPILPTPARFRSHVVLSCSLLCLGAMLLSSRPALAKKPSPVLRSARSGRWSAATTWEGGKVPAVGARVQIRTGHRVEYDVKSDGVIRSIHVAGTLSFARDRDTRLDVGLIKIQPGDDASEDGFDCDAHIPASVPTAARPAWRSARRIDRCRRATRPLFVSPTSRGWIASPALPSSAAADAWISTVLL